jgi:hypothetical protein
MSDSKCLVEPGWPGADLRHRDPNRSDTPMAQKQVKGGSRMAATEISEDVLDVCFRLSPSLHKQFRLEAAKEDRSMAEIARRLVEEWLAQRTATEK